MRMRFFLAAALAAGAASAAAQDLRSVEAHVHGEAEIAAALDLGRLLVTFSSPLVNLTGFEHAPRNEREQAALDEVLATLEAGSIVIPNEEARCTLASAKVAGPEFEAHGHEHGEDDAEAGQAEEHDHGAGDAHADVGVMYFFDCDADEQLRLLSLPVFELYPGVTRVQATFLDDELQLFRELTPGQGFDLHD